MVKNNNIQVENKTATMAPCQPMPLLAKLLAIMTLTPIPGAATKGVLPTNPITKQPIIPASAVAIKIPPLLKCWLSNEGVGLPKPPNSPICNPKI